MHTPTSCLPNMPCYYYFFLLLPGSCLTCYRLPSVTRTCWLRFRAGVTPSPLRLCDCCSVYAALRTCPPPPTYLPTTATFTFRHLLRLAVPMPYALQRLDFLRCPVPCRLAWDVTPQTVYCDM